MASALARQRAAQAWCEPTTENIIVQPELTEAFAEILDDVWDQSWLGNATTRELLAEITTRIEMDGKLEYRTTEIEMNKKKLKLRDKLLEFEKECSVLPERISKTGKPEEPLTEIIICTAISGGTDYVNEMPRTLILRRKLANRKEYSAVYMTQEIKN